MNLVYSLYRVVVPRAILSVKRHHVTIPLFLFSYAMDWEPSHGRIRVMLGRSGKIVCTLKVDPMYSIGRGNVQLLKVEGSSDLTGIQNLQVNTRSSFYSMYIWSLSVDLDPGPIYTLIKS